MGRIKALTAVLCGTVLLAASTAGAQATLPDRATMVTVSAPVSLPGLVLPAGTYLFRLADSQASRNIVQIFDKDRTKIFATLIAVSADRNEPTGEAVITFKETPANEPPALHYWYYAGEKSGQEFVYPKDQAMKIARASGESVLAVDTSAGIENMQKGEITRVDAAMAANAQPSERPENEPAQPAAPVTEPQAAAPTPTEPAPPAAPAAQAPAPTPSERAVTEPAPAPTAGVTSEAARPTGTSGRTEARHRELPKTASELPLVGLLGLLGLGGACGVHLLRRRMMV